jgi:hypothetical protein
MPRLLTSSGRAYWGWSARQAHGARRGTARMGDEGKAAGYSPGRRLYESALCQFFRRDGESRYSAGTRLVPTPFPNNLAGGHTWARRDQTWARNNRAPFFCSFPLASTAGTSGPFFGFVPLSELNPRLTHCARVPALDDPDHAQRVCKVHLYQRSCSSRFSRMFVSSFRARSASGPRGRSNDLASAIITEPC